MSPADVEPIPVVMTARGTSLDAYLRNCDLPAAELAFAALHDSRRTRARVADEQQMGLAAHSRASFVDTRYAANLRWMLL